MLCESVGGKSGRGSDGWQAAGGSSGGGGGPAEGKGLPHSRPPPPLHLPAIPLLAAAWPGSGPQAPTCRRGPRPARTRGCAVLSSARAGQRSPAIGLPAPASAPGNPAARSLSQSLQPEVAEGRWEQLQRFARMRGGRPPCLGALSLSPFACCERNGTEGCERSSSGRSSSSAGAFLNHSFAVAGQLSFHSHKPRATDTTHTVDVAHGQAVPPHPCMLSFPHPNHCGCLFLLQMD